MLQSPSLPAASAFSQDSVAKTFLAFILTPGMDNESDFSAIPLNSVSRANLASASGASPGGDDREYSQSSFLGEEQVSLFSCADDGSDSTYNIDISPGLWTPFFLRRSTMFAFLATFIVILFGLIALYIYSSGSNGQEGITLADKKFHYLWTYGPTAVFIVLGAFWNQVEYRCMQLLPWLLMTQGKATASNSVLLDYISQWNLTSLIQSFRRKHYLVSFGISGSLLISALAVFSTGLLVLGSTRVNYPTTFIISEAFNTENFDFDEIGSGPYMSGIGTRKFNLSNPAGVTGNQVFQPFHDARNSNAKYSERTQLELDVDVFTWSTGCQPATVELRNSTDSVDLFMTSNSCDGILRDVGRAISELALHAKPLLNDEPYEDSIGVSNFSASFQSCKTEHLFERSLELDSYREMDLRFWGLLSSVVADGQPFFWHQYNRTWFYEFAAVMCTPSYTMTRNRVRLWQEADNAPLNSSVGAGTDARLFPQITSGDILHAVHQSTAAGDSVEDGFSLEFENKNAYLLTESGQEQRFRDQVLLAKQINETIASTAVQVVKRYLLKPAEIRAVGNVSGYEDRLVLRPISFGFMVGFLSILIAISGVLLWYYLPVSSCSRDPGSIGGLATILARSPELTALIHDMEISQVSAMQLLLLKHKFYAKVENDMSFAIKVSDKGVLIPRSDLPTNIRWWRPLPSRQTVRALILVFSAAIISATELLYRLSTGTTGLRVLADHEPPYYQYIWAYTPALLMFCVRSLFVTVEFSTLLLQPFHILRQGGATVRTSILANQHRKIAAVGLVEALAQHQVSLAAAILALLLSSFLPITVSGLYTLTHQWVPASHMNSSLIHMNRVKMNRTEWDGDLGSLINKSSQLFGAEGIPGMVLYQNLSYPQWTYEDLSFPQVRLSMPAVAGITLNQTDTRIISRLPAIRGGLNCQTILPPQYSIDKPRHGSLALNLTGVLKVINHEGMTGGLHYVNADIKRRHYVNVDIKVARGRYFGEILDLTIPKIVFIYGKMHVSENRPEAIVVLGCNGTVEEVLTETQFALPDYTITGRPRVISGSGNPLTRDVRFPSWDDLVEALRGFNPAAILNDTKFLETRFKAAIYGVDGVPAAELLHPEKLSKALGRVYGIMVAQIFNNWAYEDLNETALIAYNKSSSGMILQNRRSLRQDKISTRILQSLLAVMIACGIINMILMDTKRVLPKNPCSIAALASLLAGSRMLDKDVIPPGSEWHDNKELERRGVFAGRTFTMGFWDREGNAQYESEGNDNYDRIEDEEIRTKRFGIDVDEIKQA